MKIYNTENIINCRDLGGFCCRGGITAPGKALRCGIPRNPSQTDIRLLEDAGIKHIIDLRGIKEAADMPSWFASSADFDYYQCTTLEANPALNDISLPIWEMYRMSLEDYSGNYAMIFRHILTLDGPFIFHCFLGKDRTGLMSMLLLGAAGVSEEDIIKDYCLSWNFIKPFVDREIKNNTGLIWEQDESRLRSDRENIVLIMDYLKNTYGGISGYLSHIGLTESELDALEKILL